MPRAVQGGIVVRRQRQRAPGDDDGEVTGRSLQAVARGVVGTERSARKIRKRTMAEVIDQQLAAPSVTLDDVQRLLLHHALAALDGTDKPTDLSMRSLDSLTRLVAFREQQQRTAGGSDVQVMEIIGVPAGSPIPSLPAQPRPADLRRRALLAQATGELDESEGDEIG